MSKDFWDKRYSEKEFAYGTEPNQFFKQQIDKLVPGKILLLGEGEGRNAVYAAKLGWQVDAVDFSSSAKEKALRLANKNGVSINYVVGDLNEYEFKINNYDLVVMIFLHLPIELREKVFKSSINSLKRNGKLVVESFDKKQINNSSGGPKDVDLLFSLDDIKNMTTSFKEELLEAKTIFLDEGEYHIGKADVIRYIGVKI
jgi:ubiquinone/menaquinone biosynthesis C-methylase UbiE